MSIYETESCLLLLVEDVGRIAATDNATMEAIIYYYREYERKMEQLWDLRDKRVDGYFMMDSIWPTLAIVALYVYIVKIWGPNFMKDRKPYNINTFLIYYNAFQVIVSAYLFIQVCTYFWSFFKISVKYRGPAREIFLFSIKKIFRETNLRKRRSFKIRDCRAREFFFVKSNKNFKICLHCKFQQNEKISSK